VWLSISGFLLGAFLYTGWYTTSYEPEVRFGYTIVGVGITLNVFVTTWLDFLQSKSNWWRGMLLLAYFVVALGLVLVVRERKRSEGPRHRDYSHERG